MHTSTVATHANTSQDAYYDRTFEYGGAIGYQLISPKSSLIPAIFVGYEHQPNAFRTYWATGGISIKYVVDPSLLAFTLDAQWIKELSKHNDFNAQPRITLWLSTGFVGLLFIALGGVLQSL